MCCIIGVFNNKNAKKIVESGLEIMKNRGLDSKGIQCDKDCCLGHRLHSIVSFVKHPIVAEGILVANCEIYNWKELAKKHKIKPRNDAELILNLMDMIGLKALDELEGVYAFAYWRNDKIIIARDIIGLKPVWFSHKDGFAFASEKKALEKNGFLSCQELNPRKILIYDIREDKIEFKQRKFFDITPEYRLSKKKLTEKVDNLIYDAVRMRIPNKKFGILFSGGIDSTVIAKYMKNLGQDFTCYTTALEEPDEKEADDLIFAKKVSKEMDLKLKIIKIRKSDLKKYLKIVVPLIETSNVVKVEVALTFYAACLQAKKDGCKVIFSGLGSEEIFAGYQRHKESCNINKECLSGLIKLYERDTYRDDVVTINNGLELRVPFLDKRLVEFALRIPEKYKLKGDKEKIILRDVAKGLEIPPYVYERKKKAAQYGSNIDKALKKVAKKKKITRSEYFRSFYPSHNLRLGALVSSGKDSIYALHIMHRQNYKIECLISIFSQNKDSFMFHTPNIDLVKLQSQAMDIPLISIDTEGKKEKELKELEKVLTQAKDKFNLDGIITGAIYSNYQRERIEKVADKVGLKIFSPLWHKDQETYMRELIDNKLKFILSSIAADGLDRSWLGRVLTDKDIDKLAEINKKIGINIAFEGGEAESLVIDAPLFKKKIRIESSVIIMENENTGQFVIKKAGLEEK
ncbi:MAG: diphthine--ammonia ligase [Candidatus Woesearchaeota archaeon]